MSGWIVLVIGIWGAIIAWQLHKLNENLEKLIEQRTKEAGG